MTRTRPTTAPLAALLLAVSCVATPPAASEPELAEGVLPSPARALRWREEPQAAALLDGDDVVWQFSCHPDRAKPCFDPLGLPGRPSLTWSRPPDHPWHHGLWFSWKTVSGVNYWEEDRQTRRSDGLTDVRAVTMALHPDGSARFELDVTYQPQGEAPVLEERRTIEVSAPGASGSYHLDWTMTFTAQDEDVLLDRTPLPGQPGGKFWGGYAGLSARLASGLERRRVVSSDGPVDYESDRHRSRARAMDYSGMLESEAQGLAILDHPENLNAPSPWYAIRSAEMSFLNPAVISQAPHRLPAGESMTLRYRVVVHPGRWSAETLASEHALYSAAATD